MSSRAKDAPPAPPFNIVNFAGAKVIDEYGEEISVGSLWQKQTVVFIFLRHFACIDCRTQAVQVWNDREKYEKNGAKMVFVGNGSSAFMLRFKEDLNIRDAVIYTDPTLGAFRAAGFKRGFLAALGPKSLAAGLKMFQTGGRQASYSGESGDLWQLGGIVVVKRDGTIAYHHINQALGDYPPDSDVKTE